MGSMPVDLSSLRGGGGAEREAALGSLEKQLLCPICLEIFSKPVVILPCQHNLCRKCANELYQPSLFQARTSMLVSSGRFRCPSCRQEVVLDRHGVYGLQRNLLVENIIDVYKQELSGDGGSTCSVPEVQAPAELSCPEHPGEKVNIYCLSCQQPTCSLCKVFGAHRSCRVAPLDQTYQQQKAELDEQLSSLVNINHKIQSFITQLEESCRNIEENCKTRKQSLCDKFDRMAAILEDRRKVMGQRISSEQEEKTGHAQSLVRRYGDKVEANSKLLETATRTLEEADMAAFVQGSKELISKLLTATTPGPLETLKPGFENLSDYRFHVSGQAEALRSVDFIGVEEEVPEDQTLELKRCPKEEEDLKEEEPKHIPGSVDQNSEAELCPESIHRREEHANVQNWEPKPCPESIILKLESEPQLEPMVLNGEHVVDRASGPIRESIPVSLSPVVPVETAVVEAVSTIPPVTGADVDFVELAEPQQDDPVLNGEGVGVLKESKMEEEEEEEEEEEGEEEEEEEEEGEETKGEVPGEDKEFATATPVKEGSRCDDQDRMSTQQCEVWEIGHDTNDQEADIEKEEEEEEETLNEDQQGGAPEEDEGGEGDATTYPGCYSVCGWRRVCPDLPKVRGLEEKICSTADTSDGVLLPVAGEPPPVARDSLIVAETKVESQCIAPAVSPPQTQTSPETEDSTAVQPVPLSRSASMPPLMPEVQVWPLPPSWFHPEPKKEPYPWHPPDGIGPSSPTPPLQEPPLPSQQEGLQPPPQLIASFEASKQGREENIMESADQSRAVQISLALGDVIPGVQEGSLHNSTELVGIEKPMQLSESSLAESRFELEPSDPRVEDRREEGSSRVGEGFVTPKEPFLEVGGGSLDSREMSAAQAEWVLVSEEEGEEMRRWSAGPEDGALAQKGSRSTPTEDSLEPEETTSKPQPQNDPVLEELQENRQDRAERNQKPEDTGSDMESMDPSKVEQRTQVSPQAVTLLFYLLAFLVILQRVWAYIGCFIIT